MKKERKDLQQEIEDIKHYLTQNYGLTSFSPMTGGEIRVPILECLGVDGKRMVAKIGFGDEQRREVEDNAYGYTQIKIAGGEKILPSGLTTVSFQDTPIIVMDHLGKSVADDSRTHPEVLDLFARRIPEIYEDALRTEDSNQIVGLQEVRTQIVKWSEKLMEEEMIPKDIQRITEQLDLDVISATGSTLLLLDFTPDNVFVYEDSVAFIDPWRQSTYLGSPIPSLGQFVTLAEIYQLPGVSEVASNLSQTAQKIGQKIGLNLEQVTTQLELGTSLQLLLSAFARRKRNPLQAIEFAQKGYDMIGRIACA